MEIGEDSPSGIDPMYVEANIPRAPPLPWPYAGHSFPLFDASLSRATTVGITILGNTWHQTVFLFVSQLVAFSDVLCRGKDSGVIATDMLYMIAARRAVSYRVITG